MGFTIHRCANVVARERNVALLDASDAKDEDEGDRDRDEGESPDARKFAPTFEEEEEDATRAGARSDPAWAARRAWASWWWWRWYDEHQAAFARAGALGRPPGAGAPWVVPPLRGTSLFAD